MLGNRPALTGKSVELKIIHRDLKYSKILNKGSTCNKYKHLLLYYWKCDQNGTSYKTGTFRRVSLGGVSEL